MRLLRRLYKPKLSKLCDDYLLVHRCQPGTKAQTRTAFGVLIGWAGDIRINKIGFDLVERFQQFLLNDRRPATVNSYVRTIRPAFNWAIKHDLLRKNVFSMVQAIAEPEKKVRIYTEAEFQQMIDACPNLQWQGCLWLARTCGLRRGEVLNLCTWDIDFAAAVLRVQPHEETAHTWIWQPKRYYKDCDLPLVPQAVSLLGRALEMLPKGMPYLLLSPHRYYRNMELKRRGKLSDDLRRRPDPDFDAKFKQIREQAGVAAGTFHDLRRTFCTDLANNMKPKDAQQLTRHSDIRTLFVSYVKPSDSTVSQGRDVLSKIGRGDQAPTA